MNDSQKYAARGVSATKDEVHQAIKNLDKGLYQNAFCKVLPDLVAGDANYCNIMHADTAGTKGSLAYMYWKETGDLSVWKGITQDAIVMNVDDMACVGAVNNIILSSTIGRNATRITGDVIATIIEACVEFIQRMKQYDVHIELAGGETADVGDIVRTIDVGYTTFARMKREELIVNNIQAKQVIVGFSSYGQAVYEDAYNGGMGSNGLTSARHDVFDHAYAEKYPESYDPAIDKALIYAGSKKLTDPSRVDGVDMGKLVLSPTRTYLPIIKRILDAHRSNIHGIIHCSGGAQTKVMKFVDQVKIVKNQMFDIPPLFQHIQEESETAMKEMFQVFNMGHRLEMYVDESVAQDLIEISKSFDVDAQVIGHVESASTPSLELTYAGETFNYTHF